MAFEMLKYTKSWENASDFPTYEPDESRVRADLQLLHDEARDGINRLAAQLNDPAAAAMLAFVPRDGLTAGTVQDAIVEVYGAVRDAAAGLLVDGTVTREKLAKNLLDRTYGGKLWVSMDKPGADQNPDGDFPVGQLWLRPGFVVDNLALSQWELTGCKAEQREQGWFIRADGSAASVTAVQTLLRIGQAGDRVLVALTASELDDHLSGLQLYCNGVQQDLTAGSLFEAELDTGGSLTLLVRGQWPYAEADAGFLLSRMAVVNTDAVERTLTDCAGVGDWSALVESLLPFRQVRIPRQVFLQVQPGVWEQVVYEQLPVSGGGTGLKQVEPGQMLYGSGEEQMTVLEPGTEGSLLQMQDGRPGWKDMETMIGEQTLLRYASGSYTGNETERTVVLPVTPKVLLLYPKALVMVNGLTCSEGRVVYVDSGTEQYNAYVRLVDNALVFTADDQIWDMETTPVPFCCNEKNKTYTWHALY